MDDLLFGLRITFYGMGIVFGLLAALWAVLAIAGRVESAAAEKARARELADAAPAVKVTSRNGSSIDESLLAAITVAVLVHTEARRRQAAPLMRSTWPGSQIFASRWMAAGRERQTRTWRRKG